MISKFLQYNMYKQSESLHLVARIQIDKLVYHHVNNLPHLHKTNSITVRHLRFEVKNHLVLEEERATQSIVIESSSFEVDKQSHAEVR